MIIIYSSVIFKALIKGKKSETLRRIILLSTKITLIAPEYVLEEIHRHIDKVSKKEFKDAIYILFAKIYLIPKEYYENKLNEAYSIAKTI